MSHKLLTNLDLNLNEIQNVKAQIVATDPTGGAEGQFIYNSTEKLFKYYNGTNWAAIGEGVQSVSPQTGETVLSVSAVDPKNPKLIFKISADQGEGVTVEKKPDGLKVLIQESTTAQKGIIQLTSTPSSTDETKAITPKGSNITLSEQATAETGYLKTYVLKQGGVDVGKINIPKDFLVKSTSIDTVTAADKQAGGKFSDATKYSEFLVGDSYIDLVINVKEGSATDEHLYILCKKLGRFTYVSTSSLAIGSTSCAITLPIKSQFVGAHIKDAAGNIIGGDIKVVEATDSTTGSVTFSIATSYTENLSCVIVYIA